MSSKSKKASEKKGATPKKPAPASAERRSNKPSNPFLERHPAPKRAPKR